MKTFFRYMILAMVLVLVALISALTTMRIAIHVREVAVPNLVGMAPAEARRISEERGLRLEIERQYYSSDVAEGKILSQVPTSGTKVRRGWALHVAQSLGPQKVAIPNVIGQSERAAEINIRRRGLELAPAAEMQMPGTPADEVLSQSPPPNASGVAAPKISLLVSQPGPPQAFVMPNFVGQALGSVRIALQDAGLRVGAVTLSPRFPGREIAPASLVESQDPLPGGKVAAGTAVNLEVR